MFPLQTAGTTPGEYSRCEESEQTTDHGKSPSPAQKTDADIRESIEHALWKDDVLRAIESYQIEVNVRNGVIYLNGHIVNSTSQRRIQTAIRAIGGIRGLHNNLVLDDKLTLEVAASLAELERTYDCKFFTGASHGVISLNGIVGDENVKLLAERCVSRNPSVRGVISNIRISGSGARHELENQTFLQPAIGETIYFLDGVSGIVKQVIINPNNRRVIAMTVSGQFAARQDLKSSNSTANQPPERLVVLSMNLVHYLTRVSGFLTISSTDQKRYKNFDSAAYRMPIADWTPPYPYCPVDVLFPVELAQVEYQVLEQLPRPPFVIDWREQALWEQLLTNDSLGG